MNGIRYVIFAFVLFTSSLSYADELFEHPVWVESQKYNRKHVVTYQSELYVARYLNRNNIPNQSVKAWLHVDVNLLPDSWSRTSFYYQGDLVESEGDVYASIWWWSLAFKPAKDRAFGPWVYLGKADMLGPTVTLTSHDVNTPIADDFEPLAFEVVDDHISSEALNYEAASSAGQALEVVFVDNVLSIVPTTAWLDGPVSIEILATDTWGNQSTTTFDLTVELSVPIRSGILALPATGDAPLSVRFSPNIKTDKAINVYRWDLNGDGTYELQDTVGRSQTFNYKTPGIYTAALEITDSLGRKDVGYQGITVNNQPPQISVSVDKTNGHVPLITLFSIQAIDNEGIVRVGWDFDGDGVVDITNTSLSSVTHTYDTVGTYQASVYVTDTLGAQSKASVPSIEIRAVDLSAATILLNASSVSGKAPLTPTFTVDLSIPELLTLDKLQWDFDGDGQIDKTSTVIESTTWTYSKAGTFYASVSALMNDGSIAKDVREVTVEESIALSIENNTIDPALSQSSTVKTTISADLEVSVQIENRAGAVVKTLVPWQNRSAGTYQDIWDGVNDSAETVAQGDYYAVLHYKKDGKTIRYDLRSSTSGGAYNPQRTRIPSRFEPYNNKPLSIDFFLNEPAEVTAFMGLFNTNTRLVTFKNREPLGAGKHTIIWNGLGDDGKVVPSSTNNPFLFGLWGYSIGKNAIFVSAGPKITDLNAQPSIAVANTNTDLNDGASHLHFNLSKPASIELRVSDIETGAVVREHIYKNVSAGDQELLWDLLSNDGTGLASGKYRVGIRAIDSAGYTSPYHYTVQRLYY